MTEFHADDYGLFPTQSRRILDCCRDGALNGVSVMTNSACLPECMALLEPYMDKLHIAVHLNFMEGRCLSDPAKVDMLVKPDGTFSASFGKLLLASILPVRRKCQEQLRLEMKAQIVALLPYMDGKPLRIDSHAHYHMIPVVFDALMDVIREEDLMVAYIRIPRESLPIYWPHRKELRYFRPINLIKTAVLNILAERNLRKCRLALAGQERNVFLGVLYSGRMCGQNIRAVLKDALQLAEKRGGMLEILAHPGGVYEESDLMQLTNPDDIDFLSSPFREEEAAALRELKKQLSGHGI